MENPSRLEARALRERLTKLSAASRRINESLEFHSVLQDVVDSARELTYARYGGITVVDDAGSFEEFVTSGLTPEERLTLAQLPESATLFRHLNKVGETLWIDDLPGYMRSLGMAQWRPPVAVRSLLVAPISNGGVRISSI